MEEIFRLNIVRCAEAHSPVLVTATSFESSGS